MEFLKWNVVLQDRILLKYVFEKEGIRVRTKYKLSRTETVGRPNKRVKEHSDCKGGGEFLHYMSKYLLPKEN